MLCLDPIFTNNEHVFHNVELIFNKNVWKQLILDFPLKVFSDLIFPDLNTSLIFPGFPVFPVGVGTLNLFEEYLTGLYR